MTTAKRKTKTCKCGKPAAMKPRNRWMCFACLNEAGWLSCLECGDFYTADSKVGCVQCRRMARKAAQEVVEPASAMPTVIAPADATPQQLEFVVWLNAYRAGRA
jgi:hypothetical protein